MSTVYSFGFVCDLSRIVDTMAEETKGEEVPQEETPAPTDDSKKGEEGKNGKQRYNKRDETPIEELYDLTKPIPRVREPHDFFS